MWEGQGLTLVGEVPEDVVGLNSRSSHLLVSAASRHSPLRAISAARQPLLNLFPRPARLNRTHGPGESISPEFVMQHFFLA